MKYLIYLVLFLALPAFAHPGSDFDENNCHVCVSECEVSGLLVDEKHCHLPNGEYTNSLGQKFDSSGVFIQSDQQFDFSYLDDELPADVYNPISGQENEAVVAEGLVNERTSENYLETSTLEINEQKNTNKKIDILNNSFEKISNLKANSKFSTNIIVYAVVGLLILLAILFLIKSFKNRK
ncbi:MAG: hypothetical protein WCV71_02555 [Patescibacteria group bacterium]